MKTAHSILFASGALFAVTATSVPLAASDIAHLRAQIRSMQGKIAGPDAAEAKPVDQVRPIVGESGFIRRSVLGPDFPWRSGLGPPASLIGPMSGAPEGGVRDGLGIFDSDGPGAGYLGMSRPAWAEFRLTHRIQLILAVDEPPYSATTASAGVYQPASLLHSGAATTRGLATILRYRWDRVSASLTGVVRGSQIGGRAPQFDMGMDGAGFGWGLSLSADYRITNRITLGGGVAFVEGLPHYTVRNGLVAIVGPAVTASAFDPGNSVGAFGWVNYRWTNTIRSNAIIGYARQDVASDLPGTGPFADTGAWAIHANVIWSPMPQLSLGAEYSRLVRSFYDIPHTGGNRFQLGLQFRF